MLPVRFFTVAREAAVLVEIGDDGGDLVVERGGHIVADLAAGFDVGLGFELGEHVVELGVLPVGGVPFRRAAEALGEDLGRDGAAGPVGQAEADLRPVVVVEVGRLDLQVDLDPGGGEHLLRECGELRQFEILVGVKVDGEALRISGCGQELLGLLDIGLALGISIFSG